MFRNDALAEMIAVQFECAAWFEALPESLRDNATAAALQEMIDLDLDATVLLESAPYSAQSFERRYTLHGNPERACRAIPDRPMAAIVTPIFIRASTRFSITSLSAPSVITPDPPMQPAL